MFDVMLIDDDAASRQSLKQNIQWEKLGTRLLCEAEDSETATELYMLYRPKIIIADMSVPLLFGLELAANLQKEDADIQFIIITDHDFDFTKHPLDLRTVSILRKPVRPQDVHYSITKAVRQLEVDRERKAAAAGLDQILNLHLNHMQESFVAELVSTRSDEPELVPQKAQQLRLPLPGPNFVVATIRVQPVDMDKSLLGPIRYLLRDILYNIVIGTGCSAYAYPDMEGRLNCIFSTALEDPADVIEEILIKLGETGRQVYGAEIVAGIGPAVSDLASLYISGSGALSAYQYQGMLREGPIVHFKNLEKLGVLSSYPIYDNIRRLFGQRRLEELKQFLFQVCDPDAKDSRSPAFLFEYITLITSEALHAGMEASQLEGCASLLVKVFQEEDMNSRLAAVMEITERLMMQLEKQCATNTNQLIAVAKSYIEENMGNDQLNLEKVSNFVGLSRIYFCKRFHQSEGISFSNYLKEARIKKAKALLTQTSMKVFEVGNAVGFSNPKYFSYVFKQATGQTPLEYQKKEQEGNGR